MHTGKSFTPAALALAVVLAVMPGIASAEMFVEIWGGFNTAANMDEKVGLNAGPIPVIGGSAGVSTTFYGRANTQPQGGLKIGTWFVKNGLLGYNYPDWMKYFGFYTEFSYHRLVLNREAITANATLPGFGGLNGLPGRFTASGTVATWSFMFAGRYGFFPDQNVPLGRLQPYVAVGPGLLFTSLTPNMALIAADLGQPVGTIGAGFAPGTKSSMDLALCLDTGIRYYALKDVSIDLFFQYRYAVPSYNYHGYFVAFRTSNGLTTNFNIPGNLQYSPTLHLFTMGVGVAYHF